MAMKYGPYSAVSVRTDNGMLPLTLDRPEVDFSDERVRDGGGKATLAKAKRESVYRVSRLSKEVCPK
jgi:hypothetical protein